MLSSRVNVKHLSKTNVGSFHSEPVVVPLLPRFDCLRPNHIVEAGAN